MSQTPNRPAGGGPVQQQHGNAADTFSIAERWDWLIELVWDSGRMYESQRIAEATVELDEAWITQTRKTRDQKVAERVASMLPADPDWLEKSAARLRVHDLRCIEIAAPYSLAVLDPAEFARQWAEHPPISELPS